MNRFTDFFGIALTGSANSEFEPYHYQKRLGCGERGDKSTEEWLEGGTSCESQLIDIPTGMGKTAAVVMAWLWNRVVLGRDDWPRRLVYCLPMRTLVEQTSENVELWIERLARNFPDNESLRWLAGFEPGNLVHDKIDRERMRSPIILMGGEDQSEAKRQWDLHPEQPAILIGTQDMLLSRALNRGYGMSRFRWPMHFGLLNNDCLWVLDETQLMGVGIETSSQLEGLRSGAKLGTSRPSYTWWMSATLGEAQLTTVDHPVIEAGIAKCELSEDERNSRDVRKKLDAEKRLHPYEDGLENTTKGDIESYATALASSLVELHVEGTLTLAVLNRVDRAQAVYAELKKLNPDVKVALIHSRFRPGDRAAHQRVLEAKGESRIVVATQAIEAGVDVSARVLITELAPWSSLVQRFGRCHRYGELGDGADVYWIDLHSDEEKKADSLALPYEAVELRQAREALRTLNAVNLASLAEIRIEPPVFVRPVIRRKDLLDLTDTTPDLAGNDLDVSRYVRDGEDRDVQVFWRYVKDDGPTPDSQKLPGREELCRVSKTQFEKFFPGDKSKIRVWRWNHLDERWERVTRIVPNQTYQVAIEMGGYSADLGWTGDSKDKLEVLPGGTEEQEPMGGDPWSGIGVWETLEAHTENVCRHVDIILREVDLPERFGYVLQTAALWHDVGKAHATFQAATGAAGTEREGILWAKAERIGKYENRPMFRHELASALVWLRKGESTGCDKSAPADPSPNEESNENLIAFLIAAHHGKVRFSIRALPGEKEPDGDQAGVLFARGIWDGDPIPGKGLPKVEIGDLAIPSVCLDLSLMKMGCGSWLERMTGLLENSNLGPFRIAFLETLLRSADMRASAEEVEKGATS